MMPYKDPETSRAYQRLKRAGECQTLLPADFRIQTAKDVVSILAEQVALVREDPAAGTLEKARTIGYLVGVALKAIEAGDTMISSSGDRTLVIVVLCLGHSPLVQR